MNKQNMNIKNSFSKIRILFGFKKSLKEGYTFILNVPPKSFRNLKKDKLNQYKRIVEEKMIRKNIPSFFDEEELRLYLAIHVRNYYTNTDCDNMAKSICDALEGTLYKKDSQIQTLICQKFKVPHISDEGFVIAVRKI